MERPSRMRIRNEAVRRARRESVNGGVVETLYSIAVGEGRRT